jgi:hypothetical protein
MSMGPGRAWSGTRNIGVNAAAPIFVAVLAEMGASQLWLDVFADRMRRQSGLTAAKRDAINAGL